jgi:ABC-2 type transport system permease protein
VRPYAGDRFWVLVLHVALTVALVVVAYRLLARRDVGAGLFRRATGPTTSRQISGRRDGTCLAFSRPLDSCRTE